MNYEVTISQKTKARERKITITDVDTNKTIAPEIQYRGYVKTIKTGGDPKKKMIPPRYEKPKYGKYNIGADAYVENDGKTVIIRLYDYGTSYGIRDANLKLVIKEGFTQLNTTLDCYSEKLFKKLWKNNDDDLPAIINDVFEKFKTSKSFQIYPDVANLFFDLNWKRPNEEQSKVS